MNRQVKTLVFLLILMFSAISASIVMLLMTNAQVAENRAKIDANAQRIADIQDIDALPPLEKTTYSEPPYFSQDDPRWADEGYSDGTISSHGCGLAVVASVVSYARQHEVTPSELLDVVHEDFLTDGVNDIAKAAPFLEATEYINVSQMYWDYAAVYEELLEGNLVIASVDGAFNGHDYEGHLVLLWYAYGQIRIMDPKAPDNEVMGADEFDGQDFVYFYVVTTADWLKKAEKERGL